ncbi:MAG: hypothetical protein A3D96_03795 [Chlamydiae bacterium RIFCSPHIGHO2_12_FULL_44_59]|nr:MAG: hypothetical protein A2796_02480 [Chlamydiae bacterium RIFCSPHIGHO2_01_FULL_44_39]OGN59885.1 MAG: hypothetical protein A3D96_03795 [Chlamydiae bacterium RIFCSPHIGHO2_12_FULL_44_59]OGN66092.1 MAG: hypothetical protein A2978_04310 [Chlamydiae bacterium RIFCSPLOWO2_01_FULL_44_52]OGN68627.1 MAG: hypothetical protein A3I67_02635 [Chlamydiae bacterium RIFCSPLOWO2_02_FULL_45_22]OGN69740.1 MAG: hypothetical protein A3F79_01510 [Chlamydiae bacterium RIFCSPLOWO2_12_FULL_45_20]
MSSSIPEQLSTANAVTNQPNYAQLLDKIAQPEPRFAYLILSYPKAQTFLDKQPTSSYCLVRAVQLAAFKVTAFFLGVLETLKNITYMAVNGLIGLANIVVAPKNETAVVLDHKEASAQIVVQEEAKEVQEEAKEVQEEAKEVQEEAKEQQPGESAKVVPSSVTQRVSNMVSELTSKVKGFTNFIHGERA